MYNDNRIVMTLDAGGTNLVFSAIRGGNEIVTPITLPSCACNLEQCLGQLATGFSRIREQLTEAPVAISFAFPGPADFRRGNWAGSPDRGRRRRILWHTAPQRGRFHRGPDINWPAGWW